VQRNGWDAVHHTKVQKLEHEREQSAASSSGNAASRIERLKELKNLRDLDLITEDVYKQKQTEILQSLLLHIPTPFRKESGVFQHTDASEDGCELVCKPPADL